MKRGRKPLPTSVLKVRGSWRANTRPDEPDIAGPDESAPPEWLSEPAAEAWTRLYPILERAGILKQTDVFCLAMCCEARAEYLALNQRLRAEGEIVNGRLNPLCKVREWAFTRWLKTACELGLSPSSRANLKVQAPAPQASPASRFFRNNF